jgi:hypothetical protein
VRCAPANPSDRGHHDAAGLADKVVRRLCVRDAILVQYGNDSGGQEMFGFVDRSFQEYFASCWMARELDESGSPTVIVLTVDTKVKMCRDGSLPGWLVGRGAETISFSRPSPSRK